MDTSRREFVGGLAALFGAARIPDFSKLFPASSPLHSLSPDKFDLLSKGAGQLQFSVGYHDYAPTRAEDFASLQPEKLTDAVADEWVHMMDVDVCSALGQAQDLRLLEANGADFCWFKEMATNPQANDIIAHQLTLLNPDMMQQELTNGVLTWQGNAGDCFLKHIDTLAKAFERYPHLHACQSFTDIAEYLESNTAMPFEGLPPLNAPLPAKLIERMQESLRVSQQLRTFLDHPPETLRDSINCVRASLDLPALESAPAEHALPHFHSGPHHFHTTGPTQAGLPMRIAYDIARDGTIESASLRQHLL